MDLDNNISIVNCCFTHPYSVTLQDYRSWKGITHQRVAPL